jgi:hypothetical protein
MRAEDFPRIAAALRGLAEVCGRRLTTDGLEAYFYALDDLASDQVVAELRRRARLVDARQPLPTPRELRHAILQRPRTRALIPPPSVTSTSEPRVTRAQMAATLRAVAPKIAPEARSLARTWLQLAERWERAADPDRVVPPAAVVVAITELFPLAPTTAFSTAADAPRPNRPRLEQAGPKRRSR